MKEKTILVVDDEARMVQFIKMNLELEGFRVGNAGDGYQALEKVVHELPDLVVLDVMMPDMDGFETLKKIREISSVPVIFLSVKGEEFDRVHGLDLGADDYIVKPFSTREFAARIRAVLRHLPDAYLRGPQEITKGQLKVNFVNHKVSLAGKTLHLTPTEFKMLGALIREPERVFSRAQLVEKAFGYDYEGFDRSIDFHILNLRRKLNPDPSHSTYINNIYGTGYTFYAGAK